MISSAQSLMDEAHPRNGPAVFPQATATPMKPCHLPRSLSVVISDMMTIAFQSLQQYSRYGVHALTKLLILD